MFIVTQCLKANLSHKCYLYSQDSKTPSQQNTDELAIAHQEASYTSSRGLGQQQLPLVLLLKAKKEKDDMILVPKKAPYLLSAE